MDTIRNVYENDKEFFPLLADGITRMCLDKFIEEFKGSVDRGDEDIIDMYYALYNNVPVHILISDNKMLRIKVGKSYYNLLKEYVATSFLEFYDDEDQRYNRFLKYINDRIRAEHEYA